MIPFRKFFHCNTVHTGNRGRIQIRLPKVGACLFKHRLHHFFHDLRGILIIKRDPRCGKYVGDILSNGTVINETVFRSAWIVQNVS